ncbi:GAF domain-containing protein [Streptomyces longispororuber]|uniref:GAF domain-containing protein n=1 Tax=Streptomyces longispororuber TaxID=68230 RepID=UPI002108A4A7|nr:GAF domain-containing protein [Streptomyces longispororuber]MCQ4207134.1 GAF domain-containing protein [Streptomyces longispororuber]
MTARDQVPDGAATVWQRAVRARERADREEQLADKHEAIATETRTELHFRMAYIHRTTAARHRVTADLLEAHAVRTAEWTRRGGPPPLFMTGVAEACDTASVAVTLIDADSNQLAAAASDEPARHAQDLEYALGEGPARDAVAALVPVAASGTALRARWPGYGPAIESLGIGRVVAVPLQVPGDCVGALAVFDPRSATTDITRFVWVADALTRSFILGRDAGDGLLGEIDHRPEVHQAAGMVSVQMGCHVSDALELVKARAFADSRTVGEVARDIVAGLLKLG